MSTTPRVAVVTVTYNSAELIDDAIAAITACEPHQVVIVDNGSVDASAERARRLLPDAVFQGDNVGFGAGCNRGASLLSPTIDFILFLNPDAKIEPVALRRLVDYLDEHPLVAIVGPRMMNGSTEIPSCGTVPTLLTEIQPLLPRPLRQLCPTHVTPPGHFTTGPVGAVEGACFLTRRSAFLQVGGFDERYFLFFEELDISNRLRAAGYEVHVVQDVVAQHLRGASRAGIADGAQSHYWVSTWIYLRIWHGKRAAKAWAFIARVVWVLRVATRLLDRRTAITWSQQLARATATFSEAPKTSASESHST